jgi:hypothetical protein
LLAVILRPIAAIIAAACAIGTLMRIFITGTAGFIGFHLAKLLLLMAKEYAVIEIFFQRRQK